MSILIKYLNRYESYILGILVVLVAIAANPVYAQEEEPTTMAKGLTVTVLLYSGRPNPTYILDDNESIDQLKNLVGKSKKAASFDKDTVVPSILGYAGIVVENQSGKVKGFPTALTVYNGVMEVMADRKVFQVDEGKMIEKFLLDKALEKKVIDKYALQKVKAKK